MILITESSKHVFKSASHLGNAGGAKDRETNRVSAAVVGNTDAKTLQGFVGNYVAEGATVYTDDHGGYQGMPFEHETVKHSISEYVNGMAHTNGIESFWAVPPIYLIRGASRTPTGPPALVMAPSSL